MRNNNNNYYNKYILFFNESYFQISHLFVFNTLGFVQNQRSMENKSNLSAINRQVSKF